jgi:predicted DNA-binding transcriptional regulator AlpA
VCCEKALAPVPKPVDAARQSVSIALAYLITSNRCKYLEEKEISPTCELRANGEGVLDALQLLRVNDVCRLLRNSKPTLWRLRRAKAFPEPTELTDRVIAWRRSEVEAWLRARYEGRRPTTARASNQPLLTGSAYIRLTKQQFDKRPLGIDNRIVHIPCPLVCLVRRAGATRISGNTV